MSSVKSALLEVADRLTENSTWEQAMQELTLLEKIEHAEAQIDAGLTRDHDELFDELLQEDDE